jgi:hypothetical protein
MQSYFKTEQEAQLQNHRARLVKEGRLDEAAAAAAQRNTEPSFDESAALFEVLPEVLGAQARVHDPGAAGRKRVRRRVKGAAEPASEEELRRYRAGAYGAAAAVGHIPRISLGGRNRYGIHHIGGGGGGGGGAPAPAVRALSPEAVELARRSYAAGLRSLVYGSLLGCALLAVGGTAAAQVLGVGGGGGGAAAAALQQERVRALCRPLADGLRAWAEPVRDRARAWLGPGAEGGAPSELQGRLKRRYNPTSDTARPVFR